MKYLPITLFSLLLSIVGRSQISQIDSLVSEINNTQLGIRMQYVWYPVMRSDSGDSLIKIGKPSSKGLISILDDTTKGIIAYHILVRIWASELREFGWDIGSGYVGTSENRRSTNIAEIVINNLEDKVEYISELKVDGLKVFMNSQYRLFTDLEILRMKKKAWVDFITKSGFR